LDSYQIKTEALADPELSDFDVPHYSQLAKEAKEDREAYWAKLASHEEVSWFKAPS
jgi:hypothetical protein